MLSNKTGQKHLHTVNISGYGRSFCQNSIECAESRYYCWLDLGFGLETEFSPTIN